VAFGLTRRSRRRTLLWDEIRRIARDDLRDVGDLLAEREKTSEDDAYYEAVGLHGDAVAQLARAATLYDIRVVADLARRARAKLAGTRPETAACLFDPAHGSAMRTVVFAPSGGDMERVPACAACAEEIAAGRVPPIRMAMVAGRPQPYWRSIAHGAYFGELGGELDDLVLVPEFSVGLFDWLPALLDFADPQNLHLG
jgi:hypothetical protein